MARIVYGVSGEGSGHSSRASEIIPFLLDSGHEVKVVSYNRGYNNLNILKELLENNCSLAIDYHRKRTGVDDLQPII